jgi:hypothetical protein
MIGHKSVGGHFMGHKSLALGGLGHKMQPHSKLPATLQLNKQPDIQNTFNNKNVQKDPIKNFVRKF